MGNRSGQNRLDRGRGTVLLYRRTVANDDDGARTAPLQTWQLNTVRSSGGIAE